jgi:hypothetical protein
MIHRGTSNLTEDTNAKNDVTLNIRNMPDPEDTYSVTLGAADTSQSFVHIPDIRNGDGKLITPDQYEQQLQDGCIVSVNVYLKLYFFSFTLL